MNQNTHKNQKISRPMAYAYVTLAYVIAGLVAIGVGYMVKGQHPLWVMAWADLAGTLVIFIFSYIFKNSSFYDPYWSVGPIGFVIFLTVFAFLSGAEFNTIRQIAVFVLVSAWGLRLTYNWARGWTGLHHEDWRYVDLANQTGKYYWLVSFSGIHVFPTIMVFICSMSMYPAMVSSNAALNFIDILALIVTAVGILAEFFADEQLRDYVKNRTSEDDFLKTGLWAYSRHPNYFGEMTFWVGIFLFGLAADLNSWWMGFGVICLILMFVFISLKMIDDRMLRKRPHYREHMKKVSSIIPWFPKK